jgi:hypothetical protein
MQTDAGLALKAQQGSAQLRLSRIELADALTRRQNRAKAQVKERAAPSWRLDYVGPPEALAVPS